MAGQRGEYKVGGDRSSVQSEEVWRCSLKQAIRGHSLRTGSPFRSEDLVEGKGLSSD